MAELTQNQNFLQPTGYKIIIDRKNYGNLEYFAQTANHPSVSLPQTEVAYARSVIHTSGDRLTFDEVTFDIILDEDMSAYTEMYEWLKRLVEEKNKTQSQRGIEMPSSVDISMVLLSSHNNITKKFVYRDCVPTSLGNITMTSNSTDVTFITVPVSFAFSYFDVV